MKKCLLITTIVLCTGLIPAYSQCNTTNATGCFCEAPGSTNCDLLPDLIVALPPLLVSGSNGVIEYAQVGNGANNGQLRVSVSSPNIGHGPLEIRATNTFICGTDTIVGTPPVSCPNTGQPPRTLVVQRVYHKNGNIMSFYDRDAGSMTYHPTHGHMHVDDWGVYTLREQSPDPNPLNWPIIGTGSKLAFCLMDYGSCSTYNGHCVDSLGNTLLNGDFPNYGLGGGSYNCSSTIQGISSGFTDIYYQYLDGMYLDIPPGTCNGNYFIVVQLDPYDYFLEENENNNVMVVPYTLSKQAGTVPTITAAGATALCPGESVTLTSSPAPSYLWSNGATTQSIIVPHNQLGIYTVSTDVNTSCPGTSVPLSVTAQSVDIQVAPSTGAVCDGDSITLVSTIITPPTGTVQTLFSNNTVFSIPDNNPAGVSSPVTVSGINPAAIGSGTVFSVTADITHTYTGDLVLELISPSGDEIKLSNRRGGGGNNFNNTTFTMASSVPIANGSAPFAGSYIPDEFFNNLTGNVNGTWQFKVTDLAGVDTGSVNTWTLTLNNVVPAQVAYAWTSNPPGFTSSDPNPTVAPLLPTTYELVVTNSVNGCTGTASALVTVNPNPVVTFSSLNSTCYNEPPLILSGGIPVGGNYSGAGVTSNIFYPPLAGAGTHALTYTYTDSSGCTGSAVQTIEVNNTPATPGSMLGPVSICAGSKQYYQVINDTTATSYAWIIPAGVQILSGQGTNQVQVQFSNNYTTGNLCVYAFNGCGSSAPQCETLVKKHRFYCAIRPENPVQRYEQLGDINADSEMRLTINPNPVSEIAELVVTGVLTGVYHISILNVQGKEVYTESQSLNEGDHLIQMNFGEIAKGIYFVSFGNGNVTKRLRFVIE